MKKDSTLSFDNVESFILLSLRAVRCSFVRKLTVKNRGFTSNAIFYLQNDRFVWLRFKVEKLRFSLIAIKQNSRILYSFLGLEIRTASRATVLLY